MKQAHGLYVITGIMASGKSTVAQLLAEQFEKSVHVRGDLFRRMVAKGRVEMTQNAPPDAYEQLRLRYALAAHTADAYFASGFTTIVQDNYLGAEAHRFLEYITSSPLYYITLCPSVESVAAREAARGKIGYTKWDVHSLNEVLIRENPRVGLWIDSSNQTPEQTVAEILLRADDEARIR